MVFVACGLNHKTAPLEMREKFAFSLHEQTNLLTRLLKTKCAHEAALLSTCNRTEIYCDTEQADHLIDWLADEHELRAENLRPYLYLHQGHQAVQHGLRVASGLDSMMLGEPQILGQMKQAYQQACDQGTIKDHLRQVFPYIFGASKRIRHHSGIGKNPISVAYAAMLCMTETLTKQDNLSVFIIGSGETASLVAKYLAEAGVERFMIASRSRENGQYLAEQIKKKSEIININDISQHLFKADVVISATSCPIPFISKTLVNEALIKRQQAPMFFLDLALPRDIEADVAELAPVRLYNIDDLQSVVDASREKRLIAAAKAEQMISEELEHYHRWHRARKADHIICHYRTQMQSLAQQELQRAQQKLSTGHCQLKVLEELSQRIVQKLTHRPTIGLRQAAYDERHEVFDLAHYLFDLPSHEEIT
jgi:glutamyl-tRNA reductase